MRISDWSSDVCSSDLAMQDRCAEIWRVSVDRVDATFGECVTAFVPVAARELVRRVLHEQLRDVMAGWRQRRVDRGRQRHLDHRMPRGPAAAQIGRAAGRGRVSRYVEFPGGDVT